MAPHDPSGPFDTEEHALGLDGETPIESSPGGTDPLALPQALPETPDPAARRAVRVLMELLVQLVPREPQVTLVSGSLDPPDLPVPKEKPVLGAA